MIVLLLIASIGWKSDQDRRLPYTVEYLFWVESFLDCLRCCESDASFLWNIDSFTSARVSSLPSSLYSRTKSPNTCESNSFFCIYHGLKKRRTGKRKIGWELMVALSTAECKTMLVVGTPKILHTYVLNRFQKSANDKLRVRFCEIFVFFHRSLKYLVKQLLSRKLGGRLFFVGRITHPPIVHRKWRPGN